MTASFSLSIILLLCFSVVLDFGRELIPSLRSWHPDITLNGYANALVLGQDLFDEIFEWLTDEQNYSLIGIQLEENAADITVQQISSLIESDVIFDDLREDNQSDARAYLAIQVLAYSFLMIIATITVFNITNSISMSVTARMKQYGAMWAVGMDGGQFTRMVAAEAMKAYHRGYISNSLIGQAVNFTFSLGRQYFLCYNKIDSKQILNPHTQLLQNTCALMLMAMDGNHLPVSIM